MAWRPERWRSLPGPVKRQVAALLAERRSDEALVVCERAWDQLGDHYPAFFGMILDIVTATKRRGDRGGEGARRAEPNGPGTAG